MSTSQLQNQPNQQILYHLPRNHALFTLIFVIYQGIRTLILSVLYVLTRPLSRLPTILLRRQHQRSRKPRDQQQKQSSIQAQLQQQKEEQLLNPPSLIPKFPENDPHPTNAVLITGCSTGIGAHAAIDLALAGYTVFAGVRKVADGERVVRCFQDVYQSTNARTAGKVIPILIDVTDHKSIAQTPKTINAHLTSLQSQLRETRQRLQANQGSNQNKNNERNYRLVAVVHNAGVSPSFPSELTPAPVVEQTVGTNLVGPILLTNSLLPLLRNESTRAVTTARAVVTTTATATTTTEIDINSRDDVEKVRETNKLNVEEEVKGAQRTEGVNNDIGNGSRVIVISSMNGTVSIPCQSIYSATKFGIEGWCEGLRGELAQQGIAVSIIKPGAIDTPIFNKSQDQRDSWLNNQQSPQKPSSNKEKSGKNKNDEGLTQTEDEGIAKVYANLLYQTSKLYGPLKERAISPYFTSLNIRHAIESSFPQTRYYVGLDSVLFCAARWAFFWWDWGWDYIVWWGLFVQSLFATGSSGVITDSLKSIGNGGDANVRQVGGATKVGFKVENRTGYGDLANGIGKKVE